MSDEKQMDEQAAETVVLVHPDDVNLADAKRLAADYDTTVEGNRVVPRGQMFLADAANLRFTAETQETL